MRKPPKEVERGEGPSTLHDRIRTSIEKQILSGAWRPGDRIPFEHELMAEYGCSRMTVNKAITELASQGLVVRRRRAGSFVAQPPIHSAILDIPDIQAEILQRGQAYTYKLLNHTMRKPAPGKLEELELAGEGNLLALQCLHKADTRPFSLEERLISLAAVPDAADTDFAITPPGTWLLDHVPWTAAEHQISAVGATKEAASLLDIDPGTPCLLLERRTWRDGTGVTYVRQTFPGRSYDLVASFTPTRSRER